MTRGGTDANEVSGLTAARCQTLGLALPANRNWGARV